MADDNSGLMGGTEGSGTPHPEVNGQPQPGGTSMISPAGSVRPQGRTPEPPNGNKSALVREDPYAALEGGRNHPSPSAAKQQAREMADIPASLSHSGYNEGDERQISPDAPLPGTHPETEGRPGKPSTQPH